jgi:serine-type D-Ala-D-Ala carboxypeptidase (penicillin-binding protein 5/6)
VLGAASDSSRTNESQKLLNYGFQYFETQRVFQQGVAIKSLPLYKGQVKEVKAGFDRDIWMSLPKGDLQRHKETLTTIQPLIAPLSKGQKVGSMQVTVDGRPVGEYSVVVLEDAPLAGFFGRTWDSLRLMLK